ncbi:MAG: hypothetical protein ACOYL5_09390 [Phototrophicaceae bacterium]|jgi:hypothetical protein
MIKYHGWYEHGRVMLIEYADTVTLADFQQMINRSNEIVAKDGLPPMVHNLIDFTERTSIDPAVLNLKNLLDEILQADLKFTGWTFIIDPNPRPVTKFAGSVATQILNLRFRIFTTRAEAIEFLYQVDGTLKGQ